MQHRGMFNYVLSLKEGNSFKSILWFWRVWCAARCGAAWRDNARRNWCDEIFRNILTFPSSNYHHQRSNATTLVFIEEIYVIIPSTISVWLRFMTHVESYRNYNNILLSPSTSIAYIYILIMVMLTERSTSIGSKWAGNY